MGLAVRGSLGVLIFGLAAAGFLNAKVVVYPAPGGMTGAADRTVTADGSPVFVYETAVNFNRTYSTNPVTELTPVAYFDFSGQAAVVVKAPGQTITSAVLTPKSYNVPITFTADQVSFTLTRPGQYTLELNGSQHRALHLFADSIEVNPPKNGDANVTYFGPGISTPGEIGLHSGQIVYIAGGAVVYGDLKGSNVSNVRVTGRGILNGTRIPRGDGTVNMIHIADNSSNITLQGIILFDSPSWNVHLRQTNGIHVNDLKIIGARPNSDGIDLVSCQNAWINSSFVRAWDDCLCVKADNVGNVSNINFAGCVIWTDLAQSMEIGYETRADLMTDISFKDMDILHNFHKPVMSIHDGDRATIQNVHWEDIRVEDAHMGMGDGENLLVDLWIGTSLWTQDAQRGQIKNVTFKNVSVTGGLLSKSRVYGFDAGHMIDGVSFENMTILGKPIRAALDANLIPNSFVANMTFTYNQAALAHGYPARPEGLASVDRALEFAHGSKVAFRAAGSPYFHDVSGRATPVPAMLPMGIRGASPSK